MNDLHVSRAPGDAARLLRAGRRVCFLKQHRWIRQQLICCFIHTYAQAHHLPPTVREISEWVGCPSMRSLQLALADLEQQQYLTRDPIVGAASSSPAKGMALAQRWQLYIPVAGAGTQTWQALRAAS